MCGNGVVRTPYSSPIRSGDSCWVMRLHIVASSSYLCFWLKAPWGAGFAVRPCCRSREVLPFPASPCLDGKLSGLAVLQRRQALFRAASVAALRRGSGPQIAAFYLNRGVFSGVLRQSRECTGLEGFLAWGISTRAVVSTTCGFTTCVLTTCMYTCFTEENGPGYTCFTEANGLGVYLFHRGKPVQVRGVCGNPHDGSGVHPQ